jgi:hypothetical protein
MPTIEYICITKCKYNKKIHEVGDIYKAPKGEEVCKHFKRVDGVEENNESKAVKLVPEPEGGEDVEVYRARLLKELEHLTGKKANPNCLTETLEEKLAKAKEANNESKAVK